MVRSINILRKAPLLAIVLLCAFSLSLFAQSTSSVSGQVTDTSGAIVVGASVTLTDITTGSPRTVTTNDAGRYQFSNVAPGNYDITVERAGFAKARVQGQKVDIGSPLAMNVTLKVGGTQEVVTVEAQGTLEVTNMHLDDQLRR